MERITLTRGATTEATPSSLRITIRVKTRPLRLILLISALLLWGFGAACLVFSNLRPSSGDNSGSAEDFGLVVFGVFGVALAGRLAWILVGRETFEISPLALSVRRSIGPVAMRRTYRFADLEDARIIPRPGTAGLPPWKMMCLETERESIVLRHRERYVRLARDLDKAEGAYLLTAIRLWMQDR
ncbi:MAG TPA: hypothetical protein VNM14_01830 [Planctomycetota bacterium]|jgi:hypothetical protein|nr:hypothetical protein [Planctomycetota bacterium]